MDKILKLILSCAFVIGLSVHGPIADAQRSTAFDARFKIAEGADLRILDDNIWDYSKDTIPPKWKAIGEDPRDFKIIWQYVIECESAQNVSRWNDTSVNNVYKLKYKYKKVLEAEKYL